MMVSLRRAVAADSELLFGWVNASDSLANKLFTSGPIERLSHEIWFAARLTDPECSLWIVQLDGSAAGQIRLTERSGVFEVDIYIAPSFRRSGVAKSALTLAVAELMTENGGRMLVRARVKSVNTASRRLFENASFSLSQQQSDHVVYDLIV